MVFAEINAHFFCGTDLHGRTMYATVMDQLGTIRFRRNMPNDFTTFLRYMKPFLANMAVGVESTYNWYWLADKLADPDMVLSFNCDIDFMDAMDPIVTRLEKHILTQAQHHNRKDFAMLQTVPGIGEILGLTLLYEIHRIDRFKTPQMFSSYCRVVRCERSSNGKATGGGNQNIGNPYLKWAFSEGYSSEDLLAEHQKIFRAPGGQTWPA